MSVVGTMSSSLLIEVVSKSQMRECGRKCVGYRLIEVLSKRQVGKASCRVGGRNLK